MKRTTELWINLAAMATVVGLIILIKLAIFGGLVYAGSYIVKRVFGL